MTCDPILIKRYENRLYDTVKASYVTLDDLAAMMLEGERFVVKDAKTGADITRVVLARLH